MSKKVALNAFCVCVQGEQTLELQFSCVTKQPEADRLERNRSDGTYCVSCHVRLWYSGTNKKLS